MSHFILHGMTKKRKRWNYLMLGAACCVAVGLAGYAVHSIGAARAKSREPILIYTEEEFAQYMLDEEGEDYDLNGRYRLETDLELGWLERSIGTNAEPFTGRLDGNGHVINGLTRPLFGVMKRARVDNLFLSEAEIEWPALYYDGTRYVDGYAGLAAYAVDSGIQNCGMGGTIQTASPAEAEYLVSRAREDEGVRGPGVEAETSTPEEGGVSGEESETGTQEIGPGIETSGSDVSEGGSSEALSGTDVGPGVETESQPEGTSEENPSDENTWASTEGTEAGSSEQESGSAPSAGGSEGETFPSVQESTESSDVSGGNQSSTEQAGEETQGEQTGTTQPEAGQTEAGQTESGQTEGGKTENAQPEEAKPEQAQPEEVKPESAQPEEAKPESAQPEAAKAEAAKAEAARPEAMRLLAQQTGFEPETIGYRPLNRDYLMMKLPAVADVDITDVPTATPSDATPSDAEEAPGENQDGGSKTESGELKPEYIEDPVGDIYILVTAERVSVGGLVAQTAGETHIMDSFVMADIRSELEDVSTYAGGLAGILGAESRAENSYATGTITGDDITGGFAAVNEGRIENCYASNSVGEPGTCRGAFTAKGTGSLSGCVFDRQIACVDTEDIIPLSDGETVTEGEEEEPEFDLKGMNTIQMTGEESQVPGRWYTTNQAYPQLEAFSQNTEGMAGAYSRASAIALILPEGTTLLDALENSDILLPGEIDGVEILWEREGDGMDETADDVTITPHEVPVLEQPLVSGETDTGEPESDLHTAGLTEETGKPAADLPATGLPDAGTGEPAADLLPTGLPDAGTTEPAAELLGTGLSDTETVEKPEPEETPDTSTITFKATTSNVTKTFAPISQMSARAVGISWYDVGRTLSDAEKPQEIGGYYQIYNPQQLAWLAYMMDNTYQYVNVKVKVNADLNFAGLNYSGETTVNSDFSNCLKWTPMGGNKEGNNLAGSWTFKGEFDGGGHKITNLYINKGDNSFHTGLFGAVTAATIKNITIESGRIVGRDRVGGIVGGVAGATNPTTISNCINKAEIDSSNGTGGVSCNTGGIVGWAADAKINITNCGNFGRVSATREAGGIVGNSGSGKCVIENCYNRGTIRCWGWKEGDTVWGHGGIVGNGGTQLTITNCYNAGVNEATNPSDAIVGNKSVKTVTNCYYETGLQGANTGISGVRGLTKSQLQSFGAAYALNGQTVHGNGWRCTAPGNYPEIGSYAKPSGWEAIGKAIDDGLMTNRGEKPSGDGSDGNPYQITSAEQLAWFAYRVNEFDDFREAKAKLMGNINLAGLDYTGESSVKSDFSNCLKWKPIGGNRNGTDAINSWTFKGEFDGGNHAIINLYVDKGGGSYHSGFFGVVEGAAITGVRIESGRIKGADRVGGIVGAVAGSAPSTVDNCINRATIESSAGSSGGASCNTGGIVGSTPDRGKVTITKCGNFGSVTANREAGGILGNTSNGTCVIENCYNRGMIMKGGASNSYGHGGIVGRKSEDGNLTITNCYNAGVINAPTYCSAIIGNGSPTITNCYYESGLTGAVNTASGVRELTKSQLQSYGAAYALNGQTVHGNGWRCTGAGNYPEIGDYAKPSSWESIGQAVDDGLMTNKGEKPSGDGSTGTPYQITNAEQLAWFAYKVNTDNANYKDKSAQLNEDIDLFGKEYTLETTVDSHFFNCLQWIPIGKNEEVNFKKGIFDGGDHAIRNLYIGGTIINGFFGVINGSTITGIRIESGQILDAEHIGGIAGVVTGGLPTTINNCINEAEIDGSALTSYDIGGIVGCTRNGGNVTITKCGNFGSVTSTQIAGGIFGGTNGGTCVIENCYNRGTIKQWGRGSASGFGGIAGMNSDDGSLMITSCYNAGVVDATGNYGAIAGNGTATAIANCYFQSGLDGAMANDENTIPLEETFMKSWALCYALNGKSLSGGPWAYTEGEYPGFGNLVRADWQKVGEGLEAGLLTSAEWSRPGDSADGSAARPYQLRSAEDMGWFAYMVNRNPVDYGDLCAVLVQDIGNFAGSDYGGSIDAPVPWAPIKDYRGNFGGSGGTFYELSGLVVDETVVNGGLFETVKTGGKISEIGMVDCRINAGYSDDDSLPGENVGAFSAVVDGGTITHCYARNNKTAIYGRGAMYLGGIAGRVQSGGIVKDCYHQMLQDGGIWIDAAFGEAPAGHAGGIAGGVLEGGRVENCYSISEDATLIDVMAATAAGSITGRCEGTAPVHCYSDGNINLDGQNRTSDLNGTVPADMKASEVAVGLNTVDGSPRAGTERVWYTSLDSEVTLGYPTFQPPGPAISVTIDPTDATVAGVAGALPSPLDSLMFRDISVTDEKFTPIASDAEGLDLSLVPVTDITGGGYYQYGYEKANRSMALQAGATDLKNAAASLHAPETELGVLENIQMYVAAAYTEPGARYLLLEASSGTDRYEIQITVEGITSKTLSVTMPIKVGMAELEPDQTLKRTSSVPLSIINRNDYPIDGSIVSAVPKEDAGYVKLKPIAPDAGFVSTDSITEGVKLGICDSDLDGKTGLIGESDYYYTPGSPSGWLNYQIKNGGTLPFRYFIEYQGTYSPELDNQYAYDVTYSFAISKDDYTSDLDAVIRTTTPVTQTP